MSEVLSRLLHSSRYAEYTQIHVNGFTAPTNARFLSNPLYQYVQINLQENLLKSFLVSLFLSSIAKSVPPELHPTYLVSSQNMDFLRDQLGMVNKHVGYVYLVDNNLKIRWAGCADAKVEETNALEQCTGVLLNRLEKKKNSAKVAPQ
jgi:ATPase complex subunit ATP10